MVSLESKKNNKVGRTPWDFATEVLVHIGPVAIIAAAFLVAAYFLYTEVNKQRLKADEQLQERLNIAQEQLVQTYEKIGGMSDQLIKNVHSLLKLSDSVDSEVERGRTKLLDMDEKLRVAVARAAGAEQKRLKLVADVEALKQKRTEAEEELKQRKEELKIREREIAELARGSKELGEELLAQKSQVEDTAVSEHKTDNGDRPRFSDEEMKTIENSIFVEQSAERTDTPQGREDEGRQWYLITYRVDVSNNPTVEKFGGTELIKRVDYKFSERWYSSNPVGTSTNRSNKFRHTRRVWGRTMVEVIIHVTGFNAPISRRNLMTLDDTVPANF